MVAASRDWTRLAAAPVVAVREVTGLPADGAGFVLPVGSYAVDIDGQGEAWVRVFAPGAAGRLQVRFTAGMAAGWEELPEALGEAVVQAGLAAVTPVLRGVLAQILKGV